MTITVEQRVAALVGELIAERGTTPADVAARLGIEPAAVERLLGGREPLELTRLERVLDALGASPGEFFARLYGGEASTAETAAPGASGAAEHASVRPPDEPVTRREVEEVLGTLRSMIDGMVRMLDAEREAARPREER